MIGREGRRRPSDLVFTSRRGPLISVLNGEKRLHLGEEKMITSMFRASAPADTSHRRLGPLTDLPGNWMGRGFNLVALPRDPDRTKDPLPFRLKVATTMEALSFTLIGAPVPNRSSAGDIEFLGLNYFQQVANAETGEGMHVEPGFWLHMPDLPDATIVRLGTIPHGDALLAQGNAMDAIPGPPPIQAVDPHPFTIDPSTGNRVNETDPKYIDIFTNAASNPPPGVPGGFITDPNSVLKDALTLLTNANKKITSTDVLFVSASPVGGINGTPIIPPSPPPPKSPLVDPKEIGGIINIPFIRSNADATSFSAIFWIETVQNPDGLPSLQLQYTQTVILDFDDLKWPHVSVATLIKQ